MRGGKSFVYDHITFKAMKGMMNQHKITSTTKLCGIFGNPIQHTLSPLIHNAAFGHLKLDFIFLAFKVDHLKGAVDGIRAFDLKGVSVTIPHNQNQSKRPGEYTDTLQKN